MTNSTHRKKINFVTTNRGSASLKVIELLKSHRFDVVMSWIKKNQQLFTFNEPADLVVLDVDTTAGECCAICKNIRSQCQVPIIILAKQYGENYHIQALAQGADDVIKKPFNPFLLIAKLDSLLRRYSKLAESKDSTIRFGDLVVNLKRRDVSAQGHEALLTSIEFDIFNFLIQNTGRVVSRNDVHKALYNSEHNGYERSVDIYISRIRQKIGDDPVRPKYLKTVRGVGYLFVGDNK